MTPWRYRFSRRRPPIFPERRRKRRTETWGRNMAALGLLALFLQRADVLAIFPAHWQPFIAGASTMALVLAGAEFVDSVHDGRKYHERLEREAAAATSGPRVRGTDA